tara:strand:+ start:307 stop:636 length:330 start_codon:yes stop_codon:yes gene_type:complete
MNIPFLMSLKYSTETMCTGLRTMEENCNYITENDFLSNNNNYHDLMADYCVSAYRFQQAFLKSQTELLEKMKNAIRAECTHEWVIDLIDISPESSKRIRYCKYCELVDD